MASKATAKNEPSRTLGPVSDLERHLPSDWWRSLFNSLYLKTDGDVVENDLNTGAEVDMMVQFAGLEPIDCILDLCCGQGRHCLELARRGFKNVTGIDRSRYLIRLARKRAKQAGLQISFQEGDARKFRLPEASQHCVAMMGNSFGYFEREEDDLAVLLAAKRVLCSNGTLIMDIVDGDWMREHYEPRSWEWIDANHFVCRERGLSQGGRRLISREVIVHAEQGVIADQFYAERLYTREQIYQLLQRAEYEKIRFSGTWESDSSRQQDLGMMAHRMMLTAAAPTHKRLRKAKGRLVLPDITVLLGDPTLPDAVKLNGAFNQEDHTTIAKLKQALGERAEANISYLDNHASLMTDLRKNPPQFVFNLCDEGFNNDAFMELHVPALLEMLGIPYSGGAPACLGLCYNKKIVTSIAASTDIPVPLETYFDPADTSANLPSVFPALVKPNFGDSSIGITAQAVVYTPEQLVTHIDRIRSEWPGRPILVQEFLEGAEYSVGIIGNPGLSYRILPPLQVDYSGLDPDLPRILGYESKWDPTSPYWTQIRYQEADVDDETRANLYDWSNLLFERCQCRDYARIDFRVDAQGVIKLLEVNPNPGWCWDGKFNYMAGFAGLRYSEMLYMIIEAAQERIAASKV